MIRLVSTWYRACGSGYRVEGWGVESERAEGERVGGERVAGGSAVIGSDREPWRSWLGVRGWGSGVQGFGFTALES